MRIRIAVPDAHVTPAVLNAALEATTCANEAMLESGDQRPISHAINAGRVKWKPENFHDGEHFDLGDTVAKRGWGDCDDLAPALAAELRATGRDEGARAIVKKSGPNLWHAVTQLSSGEIVDPSKAAGMGQRRGVQGSSVVGIVSDGGILGLRPWEGRWASRCDLPIDGTDSALCGLAIARSPLDAITDAVEAATVVGGASDLSCPDDIARALAIQAACNGADYGETLQSVGEYIEGDELGEIFSSVAEGLSGVIPSAAAYRNPAGLAAQARMKNPNPKFPELVRQIAKVAIAHGMAPADALKHATHAAETAMREHGVTGDVVGSLFGKIFKAAVSFLPIPGAGVVANMLPDIDPFKQKGGGGGHPGSGGGPGGVVFSKAPNGAMVLRF